MSSYVIAQLHLTAALRDAEANGIDADSVCRSMLGLVISKYLEKRDVTDVQSELRFVADNCDPKTDLAFMRP